MCAYYWNLTATFTCPACGAANEDAELQTHYGDGYCTYRAVIGVFAPWLAGVTVELGDPATHPDDFIGDCEECGTFIDFAGSVVNGVVTKVWPYRFERNGEYVPVAA